MTKQKRTQEVAKVVSVVDEAELLLQYQREVNAQILRASIEKVNNCVSSQERFVEAINLLAQQNSDFEVKALTYKSKQRNLLYKNNKILYFTNNFVNVTKLQASKFNIDIMSIKRYNHSYCYNIAVESYKSYDAIKALIMQLAQ